MWVLIPVRGAPADTVVAIAQLGTDLAPIDSALRTLAITLLLGVSGVLIVVTALGVSATRRALRPLERVIAASRHIAAGDLSQPSSPNWAALLTAWSLSSTQALPPRSALSRTPPTSCARR
jgi:methyl-accepting chemotaxis protein